MLLFQHRGVCQRICYNHLDKPKLFFALDLRALPNCGRVIDGYDLGLLEAIAIHTVDAFFRQFPGQEVPLALRVLHIGETHTSPVKPSCESQDEGLVEPFTEERIAKIVERCLEMREAKEVVIASSPSPVLGAVAQQLGVELCIARNASGFNRAAAAETVGNGLSVEALTAIEAGYTETIAETLVDEFAAVYGIERARLRDLA